MSTSRHCFPCYKETCCCTKKEWITSNYNTHPLHTCSHTVPKKYLKYRSNFMHDTDKLINSWSTRQIELWSNHIQYVPHKLMQTGIIGSSASGTWFEWKCLNRLRTQMGHSKYNMKKRKYIGRYGTRGHTGDQVEQQHTISKQPRYGEGSFDRGGTIRQIYRRVRELQNEVFCERASTLLQFQKVLPPGQAMQVFRRKTSLTPMQGQQTTEEHATTSRICSKIMDVEKKENTAPALQRTTHNQDIREPAPIPLTNACAIFTVQEMA